MTRTTRRPFHLTGIAAVVAGVATLQTAAAQVEPLTVEVGKCVELATPAERLACFEAQVEAARQEPGPGSAPRPVEPAARTAEPARALPEPARAAPEPVRAAVEPARVAPEPDRPRSRREEREREMAAPEIFAKVAELRETVPNAYLITLDNGQIWRQSQPLSYPLRPGLDVRIYATRWGHRLTNSDLRGSIQVERVR